MNAYPKRYWAQGKLLASYRLRLSSVSDVAVSKFGDELAGMIAQATFETQLGSNA